jgi:hypothetical protein
VAAAADHLFLAASDSAGRNNALTDRRFATSLLLNKRHPVKELTGNYEKSEMRDGAREHIASKSKRVIV